MIVKSTLTSLAAFLVLVGCATKPVDYAFRQCMDKVAANPKYAPLKSKVALGKLSEQTIEMRGNQSLASDEDRPLISSWAAERNQCFVSADVSVRETTHPKVYALIFKAHADAETLTTRLYKGQITYGEYAEGRQLIDGILQQSRMELVGNEMNADAERKRQVLLMQWQALQNKPPPTPAPQPYMIPTNPTTTTNCTTAAGQINCVSR